MSFRLYPTEQHWWSFQDYGAVVEVTSRLKAQKVLEFGPGSSTLSLIEGGATTIHACEDKDDWRTVWEDRLGKRFPDIVTVLPYTCSDPLTVPAIGRQRYDMALIDGPYGSQQRPAVLAFCLPRCKAVLMPTEDGASGRYSLRPHILRLSAEHGFDVEFLETGPLSGGFAVMTKKRRAA